LGWPIVEGGPTLSTSSRMKRELSFDEEVSAGPSSRVKLEPRDDSWTFANSSSHIKREPMDDNGEPPPQASAYGIAQPGLGRQFSQPRSMSVADRQETYWYTGRLAPGVEYGCPANFAMLPHMRIPGYSGQGIPGSNINPTEHSERVASWVQSHGPGESHKHVHFEDQAPQSRHRAHMGTYSTMPQMSPPPPLPYPPFFNDHGHTQPQARSYRHHDEPILFDDDRTPFFG
jgi:hypothetical protein